MRKITDYVPGVRADNELADPIKIGEFTISIQGSDFHYCTPRYKKLPFDDYTAYEMRIDHDTNTNATRMVAKATGISLHRFKIAKDYHIYAFVPRDIVLDVLEKLTNQN